MADYHVPMESNWSLWKWGCLRGAGLPSSLIAELGSPELARQAELMLDEDSAERRAAYSQSFKRERARLSAAIRALAARPDFQEAITWQNRSLLQGSLGSLLRKQPEKLSSDDRRRELVVARYLQRYCLKNDTIGFFGPVGWADLSAAADEVSPGRSLLAKRSIYFEHWGIDALAQQLSRLEGMDQWLMPRLRSTLALAAGELIHPIGRSVPLSAEVALALSRCDGATRAIEIARGLAAESSEISSVEDGMALLLELAEQKLITWSIEIPTAGIAPERALRQFLTGIGDDALRRQALAVLESLEEKRSRIAAAAGTPAELNQRLEELDREFTELTGRPAVRQGAAYAGRTLVYEDCRRDLEISLGQSFRQRLSGPLSLLCASARWYTSEIAARYTRFFESRYRELSERTASAAVEYLAFWNAIQDQLPDHADTAPIVKDTVELLHARWNRVLSEPDLEQRRLDYTTEALRTAVAEAFAAAPGWPSARFQSPDIAIAATDREALARGEYSLILGEFHAGLNTLCVPFLLNQHPRPEDLIAAYEEDVPRPTVAPVTSAARASRADLTWLSRHGIDLEIGDTRSWRPRSSVLAVGDLVVEECEGRLWVRTRDGAKRLDALAFLEYYVMAGIDNLTVLPAAPHTPRITIDGLVVARERWRFAVSALSPWLEADSEQRFLGSRGWIRRHGIPRFIFFRVAEEPKPCFVDLDSPIYVDLFVSMIRKSKEVVITEMLPLPDQCWVSDGEGRRFTSELRLVAVDPLQWPGP